MTAKWYLLILLNSLFIIKEANGQYLSVRGFFELDQQLGCNDLTVNINSLVPDVITFQYDGIDSPTNDNPFFTYTEPGSYWINQYNQGPGGDERKDSVLVTVVLPELPQVELQSCNNLELVVKINDNYYDEYEIDYGDGAIITIPKNSPIAPYTYTSNAQRNVVVTGLFTTATNRCGVTSILFDPLATVLPAQIDSLIALSSNSVKLNYNLPSNSVNKLEISLNNNSNFVLFKNLTQNTSADTLTSLPISRTTYCFRIATYDACSNFKSYSNEICSISLNANAQNNVITLDWDSFYWNLSETTNLYRDEGLLLSFNSPTTTHPDSTVICKTTYCYGVEVNYAGGISRSLSVCETAFSNDNPPSIDNISSLTNSDSILWNWQIPPNSAPSFYWVNHVLPDGSVISKEKVSTNTYAEEYNEQPKLIAVQTIDICSNESGLKLTGTSITLSATILQNKDTELKWNNFTGWLDGFQDYYLTIKNLEGVLLDSVSTGGDTFYTFPIAEQNEQTLLFTVWAIPVTDGIEFTRSNVVEVEREPVISLPNSFTPNGDGLNDIFIIGGKFIKSYEMQVFNRWGEVLFQTTNLENGWDGTSKEEKLSVGNYTYWIRIKDLNNNEHIRTGSILILSN